MDELNCLDLLNNFSTVLVPQQVWQEVEKHRPNALVDVPANFQKVEITIDNDPILQSLIKSLGLALGGQAALSLMRNHTTELF